VIDRQVEDRQTGRNCCAQQTGMHRMVEATVFLAI
jgi:hypothetical protein